MVKYLEPFLVSFFLTIVFIIAGIYAGSKIKSTNRKSDRHIHGKNIFRFGGIAMVLAFNLALLIDKNLFITPELYSVMAASVILMLIGVWDDLKELFWKTQFFCQVAVVIFIFIMGVRIYYIGNPLTGEIINLEYGWGIIISMALVMVWTVLMMNSMNWLDGIDGLSGGVTFIGAMTIFFLSLKPEVNQPPMAIMAIILAGTALGFIIFNFNPSKILAGTSGSMFMGFMLAVLAIFAGTKIATSILVMSIPVVDFLWVIGKRIAEKKSIFRPDKSHLHYKLLSLGWSQKKAAIYFYAVTFLISTVALNTRAIGKIVTLTMTAIIMTFFLISISRKTKKISYSK